MSSARLGAFAITFERPETLLETLEAIDRQTRRPELIWVIDNSADDATQQQIEALARPDLRYHRMGTNAGPAGAAAKGLELLREQGFEWAYWIDDDDPPVLPETLESLMRLVDDPTNGPLGAVAAVGNRFSWNSGLIERFPDEELTGVLDVDLAGGGQQFLVSLAAAAEVGYPRAELFFGWEELDFCLRLRQGGFRIVIDGDLTRRVRARAGRLGFVRRRRVVPRVPEAWHWRVYYSNRNFISIMSSFGRRDLAAAWTAKTAAKSAASWLRGPRYGLSYTTQAVHGVLDGWLNRLGRRVVPRSTVPAGWTRGGDEGSVLPPSNAKPPHRPTTARPTWEAT